MFSTYKVHTQAEAYEKIREIIFYITCLLYHQAKISLTNKYKNDKINKEKVLPYSNGSP